MKRDSPAPRAESRGSEAGARSETPQPRFERERSAPRTEARRGDAGVGRDETTDRSGRWNSDRADRSENDRGRHDGVTRGDNRPNHDRHNSRDERGSSRNDSWRNNNHNRGDERGSSRNDSWRNNNRDRGHDRSWSNNHRPYYSSGRISNARRYRNGWQLWLTGAPYPFFVPELFYRSHHLRVGLSIRLGGYYNPLGYYDYYDGYDGYDRYNAYDRYDRGVTRATIRGTVESVDFRRDSFVVRNERTNDYITVLSRDRREPVREGDYVELSGDWSRSGTFNAYDVSLLDQRYDERR